jgi:hypothetical protein
VQAGVFYVFFPHKKIPEKSPARKADTIPWPGNINVKFTKQSYENEK